MPGAYLHALITDKKIIIMKMRGIFVDMMCEINEEYKEHVRYENGQKVLYLRVLRAIYGCIESVMQWYILFKTTLEK